MSWVDRRRLVGPEGSVRPLLDPLIYPGDTQPILDDNYERRDGRYPEQLRPFAGIITRADGSVYVELGATKLVCSVYGPRSASARTATRSFQVDGNVSCEINFAPFSSTQRCSHQPAVCPAIRRELFPHSFVDIYITVLENDGGVLSASIIAASIALIHAKIEMLDAVLACAAVWCHPQQTFIIDPTRKETGPMATMAIMPNLGQVTQLHLVGEFDTMAITEALSLCSDGIRALYYSSIKPTIESFHQ